MIQRVASFGQRILPLLLLLLGLGTLLAESREAALARLGRILKTAPEFRLRVSAARALGILKDPAALPVLIGALSQDEDHLVRGAAAWALGNIAHPGALGPLERASSSGNAFAAGQARRAAAHIRMRLPGSLPSFEQGWWRVRLATPQAGPTVPEALKGALAGALEARLKAFPNVLAGDQEPPPEAANRPWIDLRLSSNIKAAFAPPGAPARVTVEGYLSLEGQAQPVTRRAERSATAPKTSTQSNEEALLGALGAALDGLLGDLTGALGTGGRP